MKIIDGKLYFKTSDVKVFTGLSQGQVNAARRRNDLKAVQFSQGGHCYYEPEHVLEIQRQILEESRVGSSRMSRRRPTVKDPDKYRKIARKLRLWGYEVRDEVPRTIEASQAVEASQAEKDSMWATDSLPFDFVLGTPDVPLMEHGAEDFETVRGQCFGHFDETHRQCSHRCDFASVCAFARFRLLSSIAKGLQEAKDEEAIHEDAGRIISEEEERVAAFL